MTQLEYWANQVKKGRISRREFMGRAAALGVSTSLATTMLSQAGIGAEPKRGGSAKFGLPHGATTDTMDPGNYLDTGTQVPFWGAMSSSLTEVDAKGNIVGDLAETMEPSDGSNKWVFKLRKALTFHNGRDVTANDVVASFRHHMGTDSKSGAKSLLDSVSDIKADGKDTAVFTLAGPNAEFPYIVSDYHIPIMPAKDDGTADWDSKVRTGAFVFESWEPGVRAKLKRNPNYHKSSMPYFDDVEFLSITDVVARNNALISGEVHWIGRADLKTLSLLKRNPQIAITEVAGYGHYVFPMNVKTPPFNNADVRTALKWAINREDVAKKVFLGHAVPGNDNPIAPTVKYAIDPQPKHVYDPGRAKFHLKKAGQANAMAARDLLDHDLLAPFAHRMGRSRFKRGAENIAFGHADFAGTLKQWTNSSGHRANLLLRGAKWIGVAHASNARRMYWAMVIAGEMKDHIQPVNSMIVRRATRSP